MQRLIRAAGAIYGIESSGGSSTASANHATQGTSTGGGGDSEQSRKPPFVLQLLTPEEEFTHARLGEYHEIRAAFTAAGSRGKCHRSWATPATPAEASKGSEAAETGASKSCAAKDESRRSG